MAEYTSGGIFGDSSLFDEFESVPLNEPPQNKHEKEEEAPDDMLKAKLAILEEENIRLKKLLRNLYPPSGLHVQNTESGPIAHIIFMNNDISRKYRQEAEEFFEKLVARGESTAKIHTSGMIDIDDDDDEEDSSVAKPQRSSRVIIDEGNEIQKEAYLSTGNLQYYQVFCVDLIGRPLINGDAQLSGWSIPIYTAVFLEVLPIDENPQAPKKASRPKSKCWNCDSEDHSLRECTLQRDFQRINANKQLFQSSSTPQQKRYLQDGKSSGGDKKNFSKFVPGAISNELREAIGIGDDQVPPYIYMMRVHGYPPGWMRDAEVESSGMKVYNMKRQEEGEIDEEGEGQQEDGRPKYDVKKLVEYPGFNVPLPEHVKDEWQQLGAPPMQQHHRKELLEVYMTPPGKDKQERGQKRRGSFMNDKETKKHKSEREEVDMEMETSGADDLNTSSSSRGWFAGDTPGTFKPPLPPTPGAASPLPPLPLSTPPATPDPSQSPSRDSDITPMPSPGSTDPLGISANASQESSRSASPTVEDLVLQQKQLMEALMDAGESSMATDGGSEIIADADSIEEGEVATQNIEDSSQDSRTDELRPPGVESGEILESPESPGGDDNTCDDSTENRTDNDGPKTFKLHNPPELYKDMSGDATPNKSGVPRLTNFASGITPHVDESLSESTGVFKKLLGILKNKGSKLK
ncbi:zinc finger CCHC domain-containing protein 8-like [Amphiura filiformis]|uniref:zinc finger CCHC domain-containing protein 8-like n=1 Tax=Amphiura filiformis TaxID=82378 RepID=UPI003B218BBB